MRNGYSTHQNLQLQYKSTFLPMLCSRPSLKDVALPKLEEDRSVFGDPLSPKIGCMGQVKRPNNKIAGFPSSNYKISTTLTNSRNENGNINNGIISAGSLVKYSKLKRIFSVKITGVSSSSIPDSNVCRRRRGMILNGARKNKNEDIKDNSSSNSGSLISIEDMDPPLPVIKKVYQKPADGEEENTIWKRRSTGRLGLKNLQLQQIQLNNRNVLEPTAV